MTMHETDAHQEAEARIADEFAASRGATALPFASAHPRLDGAIAGPTGSIVAFAEIKTSPWPWHSPAFGLGYKLRRDKFDAALACRRLFGLPVYLVVEFADALAYLDMMAVPYIDNVTLHRPDRGETYSAVQFEWAHFVRLTPLASAMTSAPRRASGAVISAARNM